MKKIKNNSLDIKIIIGSLVMVVGLFVMEIGRAHV